MVVEKKSEQQKNLSDENSGTTNICIIVLPKEKKGIENLFEEMMENIPNLVNKIDIQVQEAHSSKENEPKEVHTKTHHN